MMMLGASGVLMGTRFYASIEADGAEEAKQRIRAANSGETARGLVFDWSRNLMWPAPFTARTLCNDHLRRWTGHEIELMQRVDEVAVEYAAARAAVISISPPCLPAKSVGLIHDIPPAAEIVGHIVAEAEQILQGRRNSIASVA